MQWERRPKSGTQTASTLALALSCAGCLVTNELQFDSNRSPPILKPLDPPPVSAAPTAGSMECTQTSAEPALYFRAQYIDDDVDQRLYVLATINGTTLNNQQPLATAEPDPSGSPVHLDPIICVPITRFVQPCSRVRIVVSDDLNKLSQPPELLLQDPDVDYAEWFLTPPAGDNLTGAGMPYVSFSDCLPPDGGL